MRIYELETHPEPLLGRRLMTLAAERYGVRKLTVMSRTRRPLGFMNTWAFPSGSTPSATRRAGNTRFFICANKTPPAYCGRCLICAWGFAALCASAGYASLRRSLRARCFLRRTRRRKKTIRLYSRLASRELCETFLQRNASAAADAFLWGYSGFSSVFSCGSGCADAAAAWPEAKAALLASSSSLRRASSARAASFSLRRRAAALPMF